MEHDVPGHTRQLTCLLAIGYLRASWRHYRAERVYTAPLKPIPRPADRFPLQSADGKHTRREAVSLEMSSLTRARKRAHAHENLRYLI